MDNGQIADIVVIGSGAAGMMAAIIGTKLGRHCLLLERGKSIAVSNASRAGGPALANTQLQVDRRAT